MEYRATYLKHYGVKERSGRYKFGTGKNPYQHIDEDSKIKVASSSSGGINTVSVNGKGHALGNRSVTYTVVNKLTQKEEEVSSAFTCHAQGAGNYYITVNSGGKANQYTFRTQENLEDAVAQLEALEIEMLSSGTYSDSDIKSTINSEAAALKDAQKSLTDEVSESINEVTNEVSESITKTVNDVEKSVSSVFSDVQKTVSSAIDDLSSTVKSTGESILTAISKVFKIRL